MVNRRRSKELKAEAKRKYSNALKWYKDYWVMVLRESGCSTPGQQPTEYLIEEVAATPELCYKPSKKVKVKHKLNITDRLLVVALDEAMFCMSYNWEEIKAEAEKVFHIAPGVIDRYFSPTGQLLTNRERKLKTVPSNEVDPKKFIKELVYCDEPVYDFDGLVREVIHKRRLMTLPDILKYCMTITRGGENPRNFIDAFNRLYVDPSGYSRDKIRKYVQEKRVKC